MGPGVFAMIARRSPPNKTRPMTARIAIVGAGPAGCYTAQALRKAMPEAELSVIDRLPAPYGLVRYGVAPDHQGTKSVTRQFQRLFERQGVAFLGNLEIGRDLHLDVLREAMDAVVLATGLYGDRPLAVDGAGLQAVYGAGALTRYWNGHPDSVDFAPDFGRSVAILGNGNVAMDIARLLARPEAGFAGSDMDPCLTDNDVARIRIIGRGLLGAAKFDVAMLRELAGIDGVVCKLAPGDRIGDTQSAIGAAASEIMAENAADSGKIDVVFHSGWHVARIEGAAGRVSALRLGRPDGAAKTIRCDSVVTAIGFKADGGLSPAAFPKTAASGILDRGLFATGWFRRGPRGTIAANRADAQEVAAMIVDWLREHTDDRKPGRAALLKDLDTEVTDFNDWRAIDTHEIASAPPDRCRRKIRAKPEMLKIIHKARSMV